MSTGNSQYTIPKDGWIVFHGHGVKAVGGGYAQTWAACSYASINGMIVFHHHFDGLLHNEYIQVNSQEVVIVPARRGDFVQVRLEIGTLFWYFIPCR